MQPQPPQCCPPPRSKNHATIRRKSRSRRSARRREAAADCTMRKEADSRSRSTCPNALPVAAPGRESQHLEKTTTKRPTARLQPRELQAQDKTRVALSTL